jgi:regulator of RNase E activity RraA
MDARLDYAAFARLSPTTLADVLGRDRVMDYGIRPVWGPVPRMAGPAYAVRCDRADNLMVHAAIHRAPAGAVVVVEAGDLEYAVAGGNVCAWAQRRGILGFVVDGVVRDVAEVRAYAFPVFARGVVPVPGGKRGGGVLNGPVTCGGVRVHPGDVVVADEEGVVVVESARALEVLRAAEAQAARDATLSLEAWAERHRAQIEQRLRELGYA